VVGGAFVNDITTPGGVVWSRSFEQLTFYLLILWTVTLTWFIRAQYVYEVSIERFGDDDYCLAYVRSQCLPEAADKYRELIRNGDIGVLKQAMAEVRETLR
jgi:hypothetical protein